MNRLIKIMSYGILVALLFIVPQQHAFAGGQPLIQVLDGSRGQLHKDSFITVEDNNYADTNALKRVDTPYNVKNSITLKINEATTLFLRDSFTVTVQVRVTYYYGTAFSDSSFLDKILSVHYDSSGKYQSVNNFVFSGAHMVKVSITSVSSSVSWNVL